MGYEVPAVKCFLSRLGLNRPEVKEEPAVEEEKKGKGKKKGKKEQKKGQEDDLRLLT